MVFSLRQNRKPPRILQIPDRNRRILDASQFLRKANVWCYTPVIKISTRASHHTILLHACTSDLNFEAVLKVSYMQANFVQATFNALPSETVPGKGPRQIPTPVACGHEKVAQMVNGTWLVLSRKHTGRFGRWSILLQTRN